MGCLIPRPGRDVATSVRLVNDTLDCPAQEYPHPYPNRPGKFWTHLQSTLFPLWSIGRNSMTAREAFSDVEPALQRCLAAPSPQSLVVGGCRGEVWGVDVGQGVRCAQGRPSPLRRRTPILRFLGHVTECGHDGWPQLKLAIIPGNNELRVAEHWQCVLQDGVLVRRPVRLVQ